MKKLLFILLTLVAFSGSAYCQNIKKAYMARQQENGTLYFIVPQEVFSNKENGPLTLDMVKLSTSDTVRLNFTVTCKDISPVDSVSFEASEITTRVPVEKIFIRPAKKSAWEHRYSLLIPYQDMKDIFAADRSPAVYVHSGAVETRYVAKDKIWKGYSEKIRTILSVMSAN
ncbi:MAG: hypothetical protein LIO77_03185 [Rikenellaceae bacterium]|nr:hypothetical protein [Rikenellaceae bacterium]